MSSDLYVWRTVFVVKNVVVKQVAFAISLTAYLCTYVGDLFALIMFGTCPHHPFYANSYS